jgi:hypothetical protein
MTIGPEPMMRMRWRSLRLGMGYFTLMSFTKSSNR